MAPTGATDALVEARLLIALRHQQQPLKAVLRGIFLEGFRQRAEAPQVVRRRHPACPLRILEIALQNDITHGGADPMLGNEVVHGRLELRTALAKRPGNLHIRPEHHALVRLDISKNLLPEFCDVAVHHSGWDESRIHHLEEVLVLQILVHEHDFHGCTPLCPELRVECLDA
jgi:hypothetical protein